ncbi:MAG: outer membrane assembly protein AsmA [Pantoea sp.]|uniref:Inner membrane protein involved in outer membrane protein assembly n=1 Tax=Pantoea brenneri TaxID=472694 RepID=A0AAX3J5L4_9GAMM|nr:MULTISPECIES: outer membrane assembly protein AsmA [Pantoea]MBS6033015.1 outer membrane assembly protein AsmA [Pantoea sp.]MDH2123683.1 outer membrane assembly protein AsmA [Pantoea brenneri]VXB79887.1 putative inner membrane protein involved in outer membrane protein assembly [Pantoea brenneri]
MKRVITTLAILLVVVVAGMTALVLLVNPNDFRAYMVQQVEQRSGYQLQVSGDLRWHVWPQLSILAGRMSLTAPGASQPLVTADNMRLDVDLWPLLSHQLSVTQVMLKNAVVRVTPDSAAQPAKNAPQGPRNAEPSAPSTGWSFDIAQLRVADSLLIWQQPGGDEYNFRDFNLNLEQDARKQATLTLSSSLTRNQRNATVNLKGQLDAAQYPHRLSGQIEQLDYTLSGADMPAQGIKGTLSVQADWNADNQQFALRNLQLTANDSTLTGQADGRLAMPQRLALDLKASNLNLDNLLTDTSVADAPGAQRATVARSPVIAQPRETSNADSPLNSLDLALKVQADKALWRGLPLTGLAIDATNQRGLMTLNTLKGSLGQGSFSIPGSIDIRQPVTHISLQPALSQIDIQPLLKAFELPESLQGTVSLNGNLAGDTLSVAEAKRSWQGRAAISASHLKLAQLNLQQMVRRAVARASNRVSSDDQPDQGIDQISGQLALNRGELSFSQLSGNGQHLALQGEGKVNMVQQQLDVTLGLKISGWKGDEELVAALSDQPIPLRMYGSWNDLQYSLPVDEVLRDRLQNEAKSRLDKWIERQPESDNKQNMQKLLRP